MIYIVVCYDSLTDSKENLIASYTSEDAESYISKQKEKDTEWNENLKKVSKFRTDYIKQNPKPSLCYSCRHSLCLEWEKEFLTTLQVYLASINCPLEFQRLFSISEKQLKKMTHPLFFIPSFRQHVYSVQPVETIKESYE